MGGIGFFGRVVSGAELVRALLWYDGDRGDVAMGGLTGVAWIEPERVFFLEFRVSWVLDLSSLSETWAMAFWRSEMLFMTGVMCEFEL